MFRPACRMALKMFMYPVQRQVLPRDRFADFLFAWLGVLGEQLMGGQQQTGRAVATLQAVRIAESSLNRIELAIFFQALNGRNLRPVSLHCKHRAGLYRQSVHQHGASAAVCRVATDVRAGEVACLPQKLDQQHARLDLTRVGLAVHLDIDGEFFHGCCFRHRDGPLPRVLLERGVRQSEWHALPELR